MRSSVIFSVVLVGVMVATFAPGAQSQDLGGLVDGLTGDGLVNALTSQLVGLWQNGDLELLGHYCSFSVNPKIKRWQLYFSGNMWCPGWTPIKGEALTRSRSGVVNKTITDFVRKAFNSGLITEDEARAWLNA